MFGDVTGGKGESGAQERAIVYCIVPRDLAGTLHEPLRRHFTDDSAVEVVVERRTTERRDEPERRTAAASKTNDRRRIHAISGRRIADRRAAAMAIDPPELPRRARPHLHALVFIERLEPTKQAVQDADTARLVTRLQGGDQQLFADLYMRYFDRVYGYLRIVLGTAHDAEDATQHVFVKVLDALPRYQFRGQPFRAWLFTIARNHAMDVLKQQRRIEPHDPQTVDRRRERTSVGEADYPESLDWISDREITMFIERLPLAQRQVLMLRFSADLSYQEIARILGRSQADVRMLQARGLQFVRERLTAVRRRAERPDRIRMKRWPREAPVLRARRWSLVR